MFTLFQNLTMGLQQQHPQQQQQQQAAAGSRDNTQPQTPQQQPQQQGATGGAEMEAEISEDEEESGDEAKMTLVQSKNKLKQGRREKAAAVKGNGKGATSTPVKKGV